MDLQTKAYFIMNGKSYFKIAEEYIQLQQIFVKDTLLEKLSLLFEMIQPIVMLIFKQSVTIFTALSLQKTLKLWTQWLRFQTLRKDVQQWTTIVRSNGGPFISTNDPTYHMYVYADGMTRLHESLPITFPEKRAKRL